jgi:hypothetical protein
MSKMVVANRLIKTIYQEAAIKTHSPLALDGV